MTRGNKASRPYFAGCGFRLRYVIVTTMFARLSAILFCAILLLPLQAQAQQLPLRLTIPFAPIYRDLTIAAPPAEKNVPRLGLALAGGGAKAAASIGVIKVLIQEGIPVAMIAGTSMGAGVGGLFAAGYSPEEIEQIFVSTDWNDIFNDTPVRAFLTQEQKDAGSRHLLEFTFQDGRFSPPSGLSAVQKFSNLLADKTLAASFEADFDFNRLRIPFRAIATDIETGDAVVLDRGLLHEAMRASAAIPVVFQPVEFQGRLLVDGGLVNNLPVEVVKAMGADIVIAVDASSKLEKRERLQSLLEILSQSISLPVRRETERQSLLADLVITPDTSAYSFTDFPAIPAIIRMGEDAALALLPRIKELMLPRVPVLASVEQFRITSLTVQGQSAISDATIRYAMAPVLSPRNVSQENIISALMDVSKLGYFSAVALDLEKEGTGQRAILTVRENPVVKQIELSGNTILQSGEIMEELAWQNGKTLSVTRLSIALEKVIARYWKQGFLLARVDHAGMKPDNETLEIVFYEGRVDSVALTGQTRTRSSLILRETGTRPGQPLNFTTAAYDIQRLYALDYFESVTADMTKSPQGGVDIKIRIKDKPTNRVRLGLRYDLEDSFTGLTDIIVDNVAGQGIKLYLNMRYGNYTDLTAGYHSPVLIRSNFVHSFQAFYRNRTYALYENKYRVSELEITRQGAELAFGYQWFRFGDSHLRYRFASDSTVETLGVNPVAANARIGSLAFFSTMDTRDSDAFAHRGTLFKGEYETAGQSYGGEVAYHKTNLSLQSFLPVGLRHTVIMEAIGGIGRGNIPYEEKYGLGGADYLISTPLLGYARREFTGDNLLELSLAYRWKIGDYQLNLVRALYLNFAYQVGNVWDNRRAMSRDDLRNGGGIGLYADTIVGPIRLDLGAGEDHRYAAYFSAGFDF